jgi:AcrR family transcriptional regulator
MGFWTGVQKRNTMAPVMEQRNGNQALRVESERSRDPRVARTRAGILSAVRQLSEAAQPVTVSTIVEAAGISRAAFYSHYAGLDDLANSLRRDTFRAIGDLYDHDQRRSAPALSLSQQRLVAHFADNRALYAMASAVSVSKASYLADVRAMAAVIERDLVAHPRMPEGLQSAATARYIAGAAYGLLDAWVSREPEVALTEGELVEHLLRLLPPWFGEPR